MASPNPGTARTLAAMAAIVGVGGALWVDWSAAALGIAAGVGVAIVLRRPHPHDPEDEVDDDPSIGGVEDLTNTDDSLEVVAGGVAHDLNNLLVGILGNTALAAEELPPGPARDAVLDAATAAGRARELVSRLRGSDEAVEPVNLTAMVWETVNLLRPVLGPRARVEVRSLGSTRIDASPAQVRQVVMNLITNASDALGPTGGDIVLRLGPDRLGRSELDRTLLGREVVPGPFVRLEVTDTGSGMDAETVKRMFEPHFSTKDGGRGLGLAGLLGIVRQHRGTVRVESAPGAGTTFDVWWPAPDRAEAMTDEPTDPGPPSLHQGVVLVAEDEELVRKVATRMLGRLGYQVHAVADADEVDAALDGGVEIALALVDQHLRGAVGQDLVARLAVRSPHTPTVVMTGSVFPTSGPRPDAWLRKPFSMQELTDSVRGARRQARARALVLPDPLMDSDPGLGPDPDRRR